MPPPDLKKVLWANVLALMEERWGGENLNRLAREAKLGPGTATRIKESDTSVGLDVLVKIAAAFKVEPYHLLIQPNDKNVLRALRAYSETDDKGRLLLETAIEAAEQRGRSAAGLPKTGQTDNG